jgi:hypothetical protein
MENTYHCGPVALQVIAQTEALRNRAAALLELYTIDWDEQHEPTRVYLQESDQHAEMSAGHFLRARNIHVDKSDGGLYATCRSGASGHWKAALQSWNLYIPSCPRHPAGELADDNLEDLLELVLTTSWRQRGWIPLHAGAVAREHRCAILTAPSRGGKTTLTLAMLHLGWKTLGDDKLLLRLRTDGTAELQPLQRLFNIDPRTRQWFPEVGDLSGLPPDSAWTPKRRVPIESIWQERVLTHAEPTHLVRIERVVENRTALAQPLNSVELLAALLRQTVVPSDRVAAKQVLSVLAPVAGRLRGLRLELSDGAYGDPQTLNLLGRMLE